MARRTAAAVSKERCAKKFGLKCPFSAIVTVTNSGPEAKKAVMRLGEA